VIAVLQKDPAAEQAVSSAEFDRFLAERVREAELMPIVSSDTTTTLGQRSDLGQPQTGGELFSL